MSAQPSPRLERILSIVVVFCVVLVSVAAAYRLLVDGPPDPVVATVSRQDWASLTASGHRMGSAEADVRVVVFVDYECPFCKLYHGHLESLFSEVNPSFAVSVHDFPLPSHPGASLAAAAAACLGKSVGYSVLAKSLYSWQDSTFPPDMDALLGSVGEGAANAKECVQRMDSETTRDSMIALASRFGVSGTPTVIVDRRQYRLPPSREELRRLLNDD